MLIVTGLRVLLTITLTLLATTAPAWPRGGLDAYGCHHDRKRGGDHCHQGQFADQSLTSKEEMLRQLRKQGSQAPMLPLIRAVGADSGARTVHAVVLRIVDGDTIYVQIAGQTEKVRYIGMDTPEMNRPTRGQEPGAMEATEANRRLIEGQRVRLDLDVQERDRYGRLLVYVWVERNGVPVMVNAELLRLGYAQVMTIPPNVRHAEWFLKLQREAREAGRGLWGVSPSGR